MKPDPFFERMLADDPAPSDASSGNEGERDAATLLSALAELKRHSPADNASAQVMHAILTDLDAEHAKRSAIPAWIATALLVLGSLVASIVTGRWSSPPAIPQGTHCLTEIVLSGAVPYMGIALGLRLLRAQQYGAWLAPIAAGGAICAQFVLHFRCPDSTGMVHLVAFHTGAVVIAAALGVSSGLRMFRFSRA